MLLEGSCGHLLALLEHRLGFALVHRARGQQAQAGVMLLGVVPAEEIAAERSRIPDGPEALREERVVVNAGHKAPDFAAEPRFFSISPKACWKRQRTCST